MQKNPLISFIIPVYNLEAEMVRKCLDSILSLSLSEQEREIIVVDDGSDMCVIDKMPDIANSLLYIRQRNQGPSAARNLGIKMATGKYIQFVDGDDWLIRTPYEHCLDIVRYADPDVVFFKLTSKEGKSKVPTSYDGPVTGSEYMRKNNIRGAACGYLFERNILGGLRYTPGSCVEDEEFTPQLFLRSERFYSTEAEAYYYRQREGSAMHSHDNGHIEKMLGDTERILLHLQSLIVPEADRAALNRRIAQLTMDYLYNIIRYTHDRQLLEQTMERLRQHNLYPLPDKDYTKKYSWFRKAIANKLTRRLLFMIIK